MPMPWRDDRNERRQSFTRPLNSGAERFGPAQERLYPSVYSSKYDVRVGNTDLSLPAAFANVINASFRAAPDCAVEFLPATSKWFAKVGEQK